jgi:hypothetical protein
VDSRAVAGWKRRAVSGRRSGQREYRYAGLREGGVRRSADGGRSWVDCKLPEPGVFSLAVSAADGVVYAGTEPSRLFRSDDQGESWGELEALLDLPSRPNWSFPPRPWTSHVRWIAPSPHDADLLLVGIELGRPDALERRRGELAGSPPRRATGRALARLAPAHTRRDLVRLPKHVRAKYEKARDSLADTTHPGLNFKPLACCDSVFSFWVGRDHRAALRPVNGKWEVLRVLPRGRIYDEVC